MKRRFKILAVIAGVTVLAVLYHFRRNKFERLLGVDLPKGVRVSELYYNQAQGYPVIKKAWAKLSTTRQEQWNELVTLFRVSTNTTAYLPWQNISSPIASWWKIPPASHQSIFAGRMWGDGHRIEMLMVKTNVFVEFSGPIPVVRRE
ncbi:MAG TPA: hypothetical protein VF773_15695 [Verrucomicrobiae bacterium]